MIHKINKWSRKTLEKGLKVNQKSFHTFKSVTIMFHPKYPDNTMRSHTPNIATIMPPTQPFPTKQNINHLRRHHPMHPKSIKMKKKMMMRKMIRYFHVILMLATPINHYYIPLYELVYCQNSIQCCCQPKKSLFFFLGGGGVLSYFQTHLKKVVSSS